MGAFLNEEGKPTRRDGLDWRATPEEVGALSTFGSCGSFLTPVDLDSLSQTLRLLPLSNGSHGWRVALQSAAHSDPIG